jgi:integrase
MKRANGNGSVIKLKGKRRRPYCARVTRWIDTGTERKQLREIIGYYKTRPEAENALYQYSQGYLDPSTKKCPTFGECWEKTMAVAVRVVSANTALNYNQAHKRLESLDPIRIDRITPVMLQDLVDEMAERVKAGTITNTISPARKVFQWAIRMQYISTDPTAALDFSLATRQKDRERRIFLPSEINALQALNEPMAEQILIMIYTGMRRAEALNLRLTDIDMHERIIRIRKSKTAAGVRIIPIASQIYDIVQDLYLRSRSGYLFEEDGAPYAYNTFYDRFVAYCREHGMDHIPHECRHTFATLLYNAKVDDVATKAIIGHTDIGLTHDVYTHESIESLREAIAKLN